jgi:hypothetical protein
MRKELAMSQTLFYERASQIHRMLKDLSFIEHRIPAIWTQGRAYIAIDYIRSEKPKRVCELSAAVIQLIGIPFESTAGGLIVDVEEDPFVLVLEINRHMGQTLQNERGPRVLLEEKDIVWLQLALPPR